MGRPSYRRGMHPAIWVSNRPPLSTHEAIYLGRYGILFRRTVSLRCADDKNSVWMFGPVCASFLATHIPEPVATIGSGRRTDLPGENMARRKIEKDEDYDRMLRNGRGLGEGATYKPFIRVSDFGSKGRSSKLPGVFFSRSHHLLSDVETLFHPFLEYDDSVTDIREQFPLLPRKLCIDVARFLGIRYPRVPRTKVDLVLTIDSLATRIIDDKPCYTAYSVKRSADLRNKRTLEKLEIERACSEILGFRWLLITERNINPVVADNLAWASDPFRGMFREDFDAWAGTESFASLLDVIRPGVYSLPILIEQVSVAAEVDDDHARDLLRCLIWRKVVKIDWTVPVIRSGEVTIQAVSPNFTGIQTHDAAG